MGTNVQFLLEVLVTADIAGGPGLVDSWILTEDVMASGSIPELRAFPATSLNPGKTQRVLKGDLR